MGIINRFKDIMASNIHAAFDKNDKHPEKTISDYLSRLKSDLAQVSSETEATRMEYQRAKRAVDENQSEAEKLERYIARAEESGNSSDARIYEGKLDTVRAEGEEKSRNLLAVQENMDHLSTMNQKLQADIAELEAKLSEMKAGGSDEYQRLNDQMNEKADYELDKARAMAELERPLNINDSIDE